MTNPSQSPRVLKGALVVFRPPAPLPETIAFQINPESLQRSLEVRAAESENGAEPFRLAGAPKETIKFEAVFDLAAEDPQPGEAADRIFGLHPRLARLELLLYPPSALVAENAELARKGAVEILPASAPYVVFVWGGRRILPVRLSGLQIAEEIYDPELNPIRARVSMDLAVLSYSDLPAAHPGHALFLSHQTAKEALAARGRVEGSGGIV